MTKKLLVEFPESKVLSSVHSRADDFLKEMSESESSSIPSVMESKQQSTLAADNGSPLLQKIRLEDKPDIVGVDHCLDEGNFPDEINGSSKLDYLKQHPFDKSTSYSSTFELQEHRQVENAAAAGVEHCQDEGNFLEEINRSKFESEQQIGDILEKNDDTAGVDPSQNGGHDLRESNGSSISDGEAVPPQKSEENCSISMESSRQEGRLQETQVIEKFESGVYVILMLRPDGIKIFKRVKFR